MMMMMMLLLSTTREINTRSLIRDRSEEKSPTFRGLIYYSKAAMYAAPRLFSTASTAMLSSALTASGLCAS
jgi:hypothetical protein